MLTSAVHRGPGRRWILVALMTGVAVIVFFSRSHYYAWQAVRSLKAGALITAAEYFQLASELGMQDAEFLMRRARCHRKLSQFDRMADDLNAAVKAGARTDEATIEATMAEAQRGNLATLEMDLGRLLGEYRDPDELCEAFVQGCLLKYRLQDALQLISVWEKDYPDDDRLYFLRGRILEHQVDIDAALVQYELAESKNSENGAAAYNSGRIQLTKKNTQRALDQYLKCASVHGDPRPGWIAAAGCYRILGQPENARRYLDRAEAFSGGDLMTAFRLLGEAGDSATVRLATERGELAFLEEDFESAAAAFQKAVDTAPSDWRTRYRLSQAQQKLGRNDEAQRNANIVRSTRNALEECDPLISLLKREPGNVEARFKIGKMFLEHVSESQGIVWLDSVLDIDPHHVGAHEALARYFEEHQDADPNFKTLAQQHRAFCERQSGDH